MAPPGRSICGGVIVDAIFRKQIRAGNRFNDVIPSQRIVYLHTANPHRMKIEERDRELLAAAELPLLVSDAWWADSRFRK